ncbi:MAG: MBL fold metallo-hydrolase [Austwickia sp.]|jgi:hydroxyacylglutathione hydrolase|nr:MBL fold metallo-hydrolase [Austwickia sp.]
MHFTQYYLECLSQASYLIGDTTTGQAVVVDPRRDVEEYLADAAAAGLTIVGVINTHFHADFVSGHLELAKATGAWIGYGRAAAADFEIRPFADGDRVSLGEVTLEIMETPGHTPESISVLVYEHADDEVAYAVLTGDALFIGDVGRPDLLASVGVTQEQLGRQLYDSIQHKLMGLPDPVRVFPAHGAGSACGKNLSTERQSTIGEQRATNYACQPMSETEFLAVVTQGQPSAPEYFLYNATLNKQQRDVRALDAQVVALSDADVVAALDEGAVLLDARSPIEFAAGHVAGAINVGAEGRLAETVGMVIAPTDRVVVMAPEGVEQQVAVRLGRIGFDGVLGYVANAQAFLIAHPDRAEPSSRLTPAQLDAALAGGVADLQVVDIRNTGELATGMVAGAGHIPLAELGRRTGELDPTRPVVLYCAGGWRSSVGASLLRHRGFGDVSDVLGGYGAINPGQVCAVTAAAAQAAREEDEAATVGTA